jgi:hypothetical protein
MQLRNWQKNVFLCAASLVLVSLLGEVVARLVWAPGSEASVIQADPLLGWCLRPHSKMYSVDSDRALRYHIEVNALGMRDRERSALEPHGVRRVLFLGDSMVFGTGIEPAERVSDRLEALLGTEVEVLNAGVGGWGTDQEYLYLCQRGFALQPDVVVLGMCVLNDVLNDMLPHELFGAAPKPRFGLDSGRLVLEPAPPRPPPRLSQRLKDASKHSRLLYYVGKHALELRSEMQARSVRQGVAPVPAAAPRAKAPAPYYPEDLDADISHWSVFRVSYTPRFESAFQVTEALLAAVSDSCAARGVPLVLFAWPQKVEVDSLARAAELRHYGYAATQFDLSAPYARLQSLADRLQVPFVYPLDAFRTAAPRGPLFFARDGHPAAFGHAVAAEALAPVVRQALASCGRPRDEIHVQRR